MFHTKYTKWGNSKAIKFKHGFSWYELVLWICISMWWMLIICFYINSLVPPGSADPQSPNEGLPLPPDLLLQHPVLPPHHVPPAGSIPPPTTNILQPWHQGRASDWAITAEGFVLFKDSQSPPPPFKTVQWRRHVRNVLRAPCICVPYIQGATIFGIG